MSTPLVPPNESPMVDRHGNVTPAWLNYFILLNQNAASGGTVTAVGATAPLSSSGGTTPVISHNTSGVTAGTYGDATHVPQVAVNATGHVTGVTNVAITDTGITQLTGDVTAGPGSGSQAATIANNAVTTAKILDANVTLAKVQNAAANSKVLGSGATGSGSPYTELTVGTGLSISGTTLSATGAGGTVTTTGSPASGNLTKFSGASSVTNGDLSGDVTTSSTLATTIAANAVTTSKINNAAVTLAKIANASASSVLVGSGASGSGSAYSEIALGTNLSMSGTTLNASGGGGGGSSLLAVVAYNPATVADKTTTSSTFADVDATNLTITFTVPASGNVMVYLEAVAVNTNAGTEYRWDLRTTGGSDVAGTRHAVSSNTQQVRIGAYISVTGLTPSASQTYRWGHAITGGATGHLRYGDDGTNEYGQAIMLVWSAP